MPLTDEQVHELIVAKGERQFARIINRRNTLTFAHQFAMAMQQRVRHEDDRVRLLLTSDETATYNAVLSQLRRAFALTEPGSR